MTMDEFRSDPSLVSGLSDALKNSYLRMAMDCLDENQIVRFPLAANNDNDISPTMAAINLGANIGYPTYPKRLKLLSIGITKGESTTPETTYQPPENEKNELPGKPAS